MYESKIEHAINDCYVDLKGRVPDDSEIQRIKLQVPDDILQTGQQWGWDDTEFGDKLYKWLKDFIA